MTTLYEAAQQALDFIVATNKSSQFWLVPNSNLNKTVTALRAALAEPMEPVALKRAKVEPIRVRIMQEAYDLADRDDSEGYNSVKVMCSEVLNLIDALIQSELTTSAPPQRKPLTRDEAMQLVNETAGAHWCDEAHLQRFRAAIERAHGIGE